MPSILRRDVVHHVPVAVVQDLGLHDDAAARGAVDPHGARDDGGLGLPLECEVDHGVLARRHLDGGRVVHRPHARVEGVVVGLVSGVVGQDAVGPPQALEPVASRCVSPRVGARGLPGAVTQLVEVDPGERDRVAGEAVGDLPAHAGGRGQHGIGAEGVLSGDDGDGRGRGARGRVAEVLRLLARGVGVEAHDVVGGGEPTDLVAAGRVGDALEDPGLAIGVGHDDLHVGHAGARLVGDRALHRALAQQVDVDTRQRLALPEHDVGGVADEVGRGVERVDPRLVRVADADPVGPGRQVLEGESCGGVPGVARARPRPAVAGPDVEVEVGGDLGGAVGPHLTGDGPRRRDVVRAGRRRCRRHPEDEGDHREDDRPAEQPARAPAT